MVGRNVTPAGCEVKLGQRRPYDPLVVHPIRRVARHPSGGCLEVSTGFLIARVMRLSRPANPVRCVS